MKIWTLSNGLSFLRMLLAIPVVILTADLPTYRWWIIGLCWFTWFTDISDGYIARRFKQESEFGRIIDPLADKIFVGVFIVILLAYDLLPLWYFLVVLIRDVLIFSGGMFMRKKSGVLTQSNNLGKTAVVTVGFSIMFTLFRDQLSAEFYLGFLLFSTAILTLSFIIYARRFTELLQLPNTA